MGGTLLSLGKLFTFTVFNFCPSLANVSFLFLNSVRPLYIPSVENQICCEALLQTHLAFAQDELIFNLFKLANQAFAFLYGKGFQLPEI